MAVPPRACCDGSPKNSLDLERFENRKGIARPIHLTGGNWRAIGRHFGGFLEKRSRPCHG
jgi:hypothetical protein